MNYQQWFEIVCDDLDPAGKWKRPELIDAPWRQNCSFAPRDNAILMDYDFVTTKGLDIYHTIAHEVRHWFQWQMGWLGTFGLRVTWMGQTIKPWDIKNIQMHRSLPYERDANKYADNVGDRHFRFLRKQAA